jgi:hypothetical protein
MWQHIQNSINSQVNDLMDTLYHKLNKKIDTLIKHTQITHNTEKKTHTFHSRLVNLTNIKFTKEQINTLTLGFNYAIEKDLKYYINELIIDTENAITDLDSKIQNTFRHLATKKVKHIITTNTHNTLHKIHQHNLNQIKNILQQNSLTAAKADKSKTMVIINKNTLKQKMDTFIQENHITRLNRPHTFLSETNPTSNSKMRHNDRQTHT